MILITGANGLTGQYIIPLIKEKYPRQHIRALVRDKDKGEGLFPHISDYVVGDLADGGAIRNALSEEINVIIHIAGIRYSLDIFEAAKKYAGTVKQMIFIHTTGMYSRFREYSKLYLEIEDKLIGGLKDSRIPCTIIRPTMIYGSLRDKNMNKLIDYLANKKFFPLFGRHGKLQPVYFKDLGNAVVAAVYNEKAFNKAYNVSGGSVHTYGEIVRMVREGINSKILVIPVPYALALAAGWIYEKIAASPRVTLEQIRRLSEDKVYNHDEAATDLGFMPVTFTEGIKNEIDEYLFSKGGVNVNV